MGTTIRPEISQKSKYYISKHRYYELKHFCLQYHDWMKERYYIRENVLGSTSVITANSDGSKDSPVEKAVIRLEELNKKISLIVDTIKEVDESLYNYILMSVVDAASYDSINTKFGVPCCKEVFYKKYREFFYKLDKKRG